MTQIEIVTDAFRSWGFIAGFLGLIDFKMRVTSWLQYQRVNHPLFHWTNRAPLESFRAFLASWDQFHLEASTTKYPGIDAWGKLWVCSFLFFAGIGLPIFNRLGIGFHEPPALLLMFVAWPMVSSAGWIYVIARSNDWRFHTGIGLTSLIATMLGSWATAHV